MHFSKIAHLMCPYGILSEVKVQCVIAIYTHGSFAHYLCICLFVMHLVMMDSIELG